MRCICTLRQNRCKFTLLFSPLSLPFFSLVLCFLAASSLFVHHYAITACSCLGFCLVLRSKIPAQSRGWEDEGSVQGDWCSKCAHSHASDGSCIQSNSSYVWVEIRKASIPMLGESPVFIYAPLLCLSHTPFALCLALQKQQHDGPSPFPVALTNDKLQRHEAVSFPHPHTPIQFFRFFFFLWQSS